LARNKKDKQVLITQILAQL